MPTLIAKILSCKNAKDLCWRSLIVWIKAQLSALFWCNINFIRFEETIYNFFSCFHLTRRWWLCLFVCSAGVLLIRSRLSICWPANNAPLWTINLKLASKKTKELHLMSVISFKTLPFIKTSKHIVPFRPPKSFTCNLFWRNKPNNDNKIMYIFGFREPQGPARCAYAE